MGLFNSGNNTNDKANEAKNMASAAGKAASGNILGAAKDAAKGGILKKIGKMLLAAFLANLLKLVIVFSIITFLAGGFVGVMNRMKDQMINVTTITRTQKSGFFNKLFKKIFDLFGIEDGKNRWINIGEKFKIAIDGETLDTIGLVGDPKTEEMIQEYRGDIKYENYDIPQIYTRDLGSKRIVLEKLRMLGEETEYTRYDKIDDLVKDEKVFPDVRKYIAEFIRADIISQNLHRRKAIDGENLIAKGELVKEGEQDKIDGGIFVYRAQKEDKNGESIYKVQNFYGGGMEGINNKEYYKLMEYMPEEEFLGKIRETSFENIGIEGKTKPAEDPEEIKELRRRYTVDSETGNIVYISTYSKKTKAPEESDVAIEYNDLVDFLEDAEEKIETYTIYCEDYKRLTQKYAMPYEYLINMVDITQNPEFVYHVALMARRTDIKLVVQDNVDVTVDATPEIDTRGEIVRRKERWI